jgi:hypothetical protein
MNEGYKIPLEDLNHPASDTEAAVQEKQKMILRTLFTAGRENGVPHMELLASSPSDEHALIESALARLVSSTLVRQQIQSFPDDAYAPVYYVLDEK